MWGSAWFTDGEHDVRTALVHPGTNCPDHADYVDLFIAGIFVKLAADVRLQTSAPGPWTHFLTIPYLPQCFVSRCRLRCFVGCSFRTPTPREWIWRDQKVSLEAWDSDIVLADSY